MTNKHIEEYLDYYCTMSNSTPFAVLLKGKWGCGKTHFIKGYIKSRKDKKVLHISLYGIDNTIAIKEKIVSELIPFIPKKYCKFTNGLFKKIKSIPKIKEWIPSSTDELLVDIFLNLNKKYIFVFDDLERCNIKIDKLLGYINNFVEFKNQKIILIANEEEIFESDKYAKIKEKLIGREFHINSSLGEAIKLFVGELQNKELVRYSENIEKLLSKIFIQSGYDNLRLMQQALSHFEYFFGTFSTKAKEDAELFERIFYEFVVIFVEHKKGKIKSDQFFNEYPHFFRGLNTKKNKKYFLDKYDYGISDWLTCFNVSILGKILQGIELSKKEKRDMIDNFESLSGINKESWQLLWHCYDQGDEDFIKNLKDVLEKWDKKEYNDLLVVLHTYGILLGLSQDGLLNKDKEEIFDEGKEHIAKLIEEKKLPLKIREQNAGFSWRESAYGLGYSGMRNKEWKMLIEFIDKKLDELRGDYIKEKIKNELMPILRNEKIYGDLNLLINHNFLHHNGNKEAYFQYLDVNEMVEVMINGDRSILSVLQKAFKERYENMKDQITGIEEEMPFLKKLKKKLENKVEEIESKFGNKKTPKSFLLQSFINNAIEPFIKPKEEANIIEE